MKQVSHPLFAGVLRKPRVADDEYEYHARQCEECRPLEMVCPRCGGAGVLSKRVGMGQWAYLPCECRSDSMRRAQEIYSGLNLRTPLQTFGVLEAKPEIVNALQAAVDFADNPTPYHILTIAGGVGTGKTHLLQAIGWESLKHGRQPKFIPVARYLDRLRATFNDDSPVQFEQVYQPLEAAQILLLDDIGAERLTLWGQEQLYKIVNHRWQESLPMAVSMNLDSPQAKDIYGARTADRLFDTGSGRVRVVSTGTKSYRTGR